MAYTEPTAADLKTRYPAFASVADATVETYLGDAGSYVDQSWREADYIPAKVAMAAHLMALAGIGTRSEAATYAAAGINRIRSGNFDVSLSDSVVAKASGSGLEATAYGEAYKRLLRKNKGGPRVAIAPAPADGWGPLAQLNNGGIVPWAS